MQRISRRNFMQSAALAVPALGAGAALAQRGADADIDVERDIVFATGGDIDLHLDVYRPPAALAKRMAVIHLHGGGFFTGSKAGVATSSREFARQGYVSVASQYRLTGQARWPAQIQDTNAAIRWTRANAERLDIDPDNIAVAGYSAGGLLALFAAANLDDMALEGAGGNAGVRSNVAACIAFYPATQASPGLLPDGASEAELTAASPGTYVSPDFAPTIFLHGVEDTTIPYANSVDFFERLHAAGVKADLHLFQGAPHAYETRNEDAARASAQVSNLFLDRVVVNPTEYPPFNPGGGRPGRG